MFLARILEALIIGSTSARNEPQPSSTDEGTEPTCSSNIVSNLEIDDQ